jgi:diguanylate cyclase (GGDEF)-like protein
MALTIVFAASALLLGFGGPYLASRLMLKPVANLLDTVEDFRGGKKEARSNIRPSNEIGQLARSLDDLLDELQESDRKLLALAFYDSTTGLPNRQFFEERLSGSVVTARLQGRAMGLLTLHLEGLKQVNETIDRRAGDDLVRQVASRIRETVRMGDVVSRQVDEDETAEVSHLGGDEFTILLTRLAKPADAAIASQRILSKLAEPFKVGDHDIVVSMSIGIAVYPQDGADTPDLLRSSNAAMNEAKRKGGNAYQFYSEAMNVSNARKLHIQSRLGTAIERNDLSVHYQPIRRAKDGHLSGAEALLRWTDSEMGPVGPEEFVPIAEQAGLIGKIGRWVLDAACSQLREWHDAGYSSLRMSVNVSASELRDADWVESVEGTLEEYELSPGCIDLEITETTIIGDDPRTVASLTRLSELGVGIVLDDFGTGYSSLSHLSRLPISRVKVDRSFVSGISDGEAGAALAGGIVALAQGLRLEVVAEGVETHEQANFLRSRGASELQGYLISRPVAASEFERFMTREKVG